MTPHVITPRRWAEELGSVVPSWSPLDGPDALIVDGDWESGRAPGADTRRPTVPVIGRLRTAPGPDAGPLADACDLLVGDSGDEAPGAVPGGDGAVGLLADRIGSNPMAASVLCQLLRGSGELDVAAGLLAESLAYATLQSGREFGRWLEDRGPDRGPDPASAPIVVERMVGEVRVTLDRRGRHNALDAAMRDALVEAFDLVAEDPSITSVHLSGTGPSFCSGGDLGEFGTVPDPAVGHLVRSERLPARSLARIADRVRASVHGATIGAGAELAAFAWTVEAEPDTTFSLPEVGMGLVPGSGGTVSLPRRIGRHRTGWLAVSGEAVDVATALAWGLVDRRAG